MSEARGRRRVVGLADLAVVVAAAAGGAALLRGAGGFVWTPTRSALGAMLTARPAGTGTEVNPHRVFAAGAMLVGVGVCVGLGVGVRRGRGGWFGAAWRVGAIAVLAALLGSSSEVLSAERLAQWVKGSVEERRLEAQVETVPLSLALALGGVLFAVAPARPRRAGRGGGGFAWMRPTSALLEGIVLYTLATGMIVMLILIAMEAVRNAFHRPGEMARAAATGDLAASLAGRFGPESLARRARESALEGVAVLAACVVCATWLGNDLRGGTRGRPGRLGVGLRAVSAAACWAGLFRLTGWTMPRLQIWYVQGFVDTIHPRISTAALAGFGLLALGLAAAGTAADLSPAAPPPGRTKIAKLYRLVGTILLGACLLVVALSGVARLRPEWSPLPAWLTDGILMFLGDPSGDLRDSSNRFANIVAPMFDLDALPRWWLLGWLTYGFVRLVLAKGEEQAALDLLSSRPDLLAVFIGRSLALLGLILALFPAIVTTSIGLQQILF